MLNYIKYAGYCNARSYGILNLKRMETLSVIIPALNEGPFIGRALEAVGRAKGVETIVVDGGSTDDTVEVSGKYAARVISSPRGRALQMNAGAGEAHGGILMFLHADCLPPEGYEIMVRDTLGEPGVIAGAFDIRIDRRGPAYRAIEKMANLRSRLTRVPYGDQGVFIRSESFEALGGFAEIPLMEDLEFAERAKRTGRIMFVKHPVLVSPRRWAAEGVVYTTLRNWTLALAYTLFRVSPHKLARFYGDLGK